MKPVKDLTGKKFGNLTVIKRNGYLSGKKRKAVAWLCLCDCGTLKTIRGHNLTTGNTKGCGCLIGKTHGGTTHPLYLIWRNLRQRCGVVGGANESAVKNYIGRGIKVCREWAEAFEPFYEWAKDRWRKGLEIDRIDNNNNYMPSNCRFVRHKINGQNQQNSKLWTINGVVYKSASEAARDMCVTKQTIIAWCNGRQRGTYFTPPKKGCYSEKKYA